LSIYNGGNVYFDSMLEEKGGWISRETPKHDVEVVDVVIEVMIEASQCKFEDGLRPFRAQSGEILPLDIERNSLGFWLGKVAPLKVDFQKLLIHIALSKVQLVITIYVGPKPNPQALAVWLPTLNHELGGNSIEFCRNVGKGYFVLSNDMSDVVHNALLLSAFKSKCAHTRYKVGFQGLTKVITPII